jgi:putative DNA primase/helicase
LRRANLQGGVRVARSLDDVARQMAGCGIVVPASHVLQVTGRGFRRFRPDGQKSAKKSAWYRIYENRTDAGRVFFSGSFGIRNESYLIEPSFEGWSLAERAEAQKRAQAAAKQAEADRRKLAQTAADKAARLWASGRTEVRAEHPYLVRKGIRAYGLREAFGKLLVPMRRADGSLAGLQLILAEKTEDGTDKLFLTGSDTAACFHVLGPDPVPDDVPAIFFGEGYATCASVHAATGLPTVVCFNAGNIEPVIKAWRGLYPSARFIVAGDDDRHLMPRYHARLARFGITQAPVDGETRKFQHPELGSIWVTAAWRTDKSGQFRIEGEIVYLRAEREVRERLDIANAGRVKALAAAAAHRCDLVFPEFGKNDDPGTDFNDLQASEGADRVRAQLEAVLGTPSGSAPAQRRGKGGGPGPGWAAERFTLIYGTDTLWDANTREIVRVAAAKLAYRRSIEAWLDSADRRMVRQDQMLFEPSGQVPEGCINLFDALPLKPDLRKPHDLIVDHLHMLCDGDDALFDWVVKWLAYPLQHPGAKMHTSIVMHGRREGTGKSILFDEVMAPIYGRYARVINQALLNSDFNGWVSRLLFCIADEVLTQQDRKHQKGLLKGLITSGHHNINEKNLPCRTERNFTNFVFVSNEIQPLALDELDRRYTVIYIDRPQPEKYFRALVQQINNGGIEGFFGYLLRYPLGDFSPATKPYDNKARRRLITLGMSPERKFYEYWSQGLTELPFVPCLAKHLYQGFQAWCKVNGERFVPNSTVFGATVGLLIPKRSMRVEIYPAGYDPTDPHAGDVSMVRYQGIVYLPPKPAKPPDGAQGPPEDLAPTAPTEDDVQYGVIAFQKALEAMARDVRRAVI